MSDATPPNPDAAPPGTPVPADGAQPPARPARQRGVMTRLLGGKRMGRRMRWTLRLLCIIPVLLITTALLASRSPLVGMMVSKKMKSLLGAESSMGSAVISVDGRLVVRDLSLRVPGIDGKAGEFLAARRAEVDIGWAGILCGNAKPRSVRLDRPLFRVSQAIDSGTVNLASLRPPKSGAHIEKPPRVDVVEGTVELGEHGAGTAYRTLTHMGVDGFLVPSRTENGVYKVRLHEIGKSAARPAPGSTPPGQATPGPAMLLEGVVDLDTSAAKVELKNLDLNIAGARSVPTFVRDVWGSMNMRGRIPRATFEYDPTGGLAVGLDLENVAMDALVPAESVSGRAGDTLSLSNVNGRIRVSGKGLRADLDAVVEDQTTPSHVMLRTEGTSLTSALKCEVLSTNFHIEKDPALLPLLPASVREKLAMFGGPTAVVDTQVLIERGPPGPDGPAPVSVSGWARLRHGTAAFHKFPYPFTEMAGTVIFDDKKIEFQDLTGEGPTGARLTASGTIAPPDKTSEVDVRVVVKDVPVDEVLEASLPDDRKRVIGYLFDRAALERLVEQGLVLTASGQRELRARLEEITRRSRGAGGAERAALDRQIAGLERRLQAPEFDFGGVANFDIHVHCPRGEDADYDYEVTLELPRAGIMARVFPLPVLASDVALEITARSARLLRGQFHGISGGTATLKAAVELETPDGESVMRPSVEVDAKGVPVDELLLAALPDDEPPRMTEEDRESGGRPSATALLRSLNLSGAVDASVNVASREGDEGLAVGLKIGLDGLAAHPAPAGKTPQLALTDLTGMVLISEDRLAIPSITGVLRREGSTPGEQVGTMGISLSADLPPKDAPQGTALQAMHVSVALSEFDLTAPVGDAVELFAPEAASEVASLREQRRPEGRVDALLTVDKLGEAPADISVEVGRMDGLALNALGHRLKARYVHGSARFASADVDKLGFSDFRADVWVDDPGAAPGAADAPTGMTLDGELLLTTPERGVPAGQGGPERLLISVPETTLECALVRAGLENALPPGALARIDQFKPRGVAGAVLNIETRASAPGKEPQTTVSGELSPRRLTLTADKQNVVLDEMTGSVEFWKEHGRFKKLWGKSDGWDTTVDGTWETRGEDVVFDLGVEVEAESLKPQLKALLPEAARDVISRLRLDLPGRVALRDGHLKAVRSTDPARSSASVDGTFLFTGGKVDVGAPLRNMDGRVTFSVDRPAGEDTAKYNVALEADRVTASALEVSNLRARVASGTQRGQLVMPSFSADCVGGRITATGTFLSPPEKPGEARLVERGPEYRLDLTMADVRFGPLLAAMGAGPKGGTVSPTDESRGRIDGSLALRGRIGEPSTREGRGSARIYGGGDIVKMPLVMGLVQLSNLQVPSNDKLDYAQSTFHISGTTLTFEQIVLLSRAFSISGAGTLRWPSMSLDLRFNSRSAARVPLWTGLVETLRDELVTTTVKGTVSRPEVGAEPFRGTRRLLGNLFGSDTPAPVADPRMEESARRERARLKNLPSVRPDSPGPEGGAAGAAGAMEEGPAEGSGE